MKETSLAHKKSKQDISLTQEELRTAAWDLGQHFPLGPQGNLVTLSMVQPHLGFVYWKLQKESVESLSDIYKERFHGSRLVLRIYDITDIDFNGWNAHYFFDIDIHGLSGNYYFPLDQTGRFFLAEVGFRLHDGHFHAMKRSQTVHFVNDHVTNQFHYNGLFVRSPLDPAIPVENIFNASVFKEMHLALKDIPRTQTQSLFIVSYKAKQDPDMNKALGAFIRDFTHKIKHFGIKTRIFIPQKEIDLTDMQTAIKDIYQLSRDTYQQLALAHQKQDISFIHCHNWYTTSAGIRASEILNIPMVLTLHETASDLRAKITDEAFLEYIGHCEKNAIHKAHLIVVSHEATRDHLLREYQVPAKKIVVIPMPTRDIPQCHIESPADIRRTFGIDLQAKIGLFAGEISHATGADLLVNSLPGVCGNVSKAQFILAGEGPLKGDLQNHCWHMGLGEKCHFWGDVDKDTFEKLMIIADFVVIPARQWPGEELAQMAIHFGKPVLTTHQAHLSGIKHGMNGIVAYDNLNSMIWGLKEIINHPLPGSMIRFHAYNTGTNTPSLEKIVVHHFIHFEKVLHHLNKKTIQNQHLPHRYHYLKLNAVALSEGEVHG